MEDTQLTQNNSPAAGPLVAKTSDGLNLSVQMYGDWNDVFWGGNKPAPRRVVRERNPEQAAFARSNSCI
jgi:hypothetical protein